MNHLSEKFVDDLTSRAKDKFFGRRYAEDEIRLCGEISMIEDVYYPYGSNPREISERRYYHGSGGYYSKIESVRGAITPLPKNPLTL